MHHSQTKRSSFALFSCIYIIKVKINSTENVMFHRKRTLALFSHKKKLWKGTLFTFFFNVWDMNSPQLYIKNKWYQRNGQKKNVENTSWFQPDINDSVGCLLEMWFQLALAVITFKEEHSTRLYTKVVFGALIPVMEERIRSCVATNLLLTVEERLG